MITQQQFKTLEDLFKYYNIELFNETLPDCLVNLSRHNQAHGFFAPERWKLKEGNVIHEISLNPDTINRPDKAWHSTLVHEMVHLWQETHGTPSRKAYHDKEWADKMEAVGLMPSDNGEEGGKRTGQKLTHYVIHKGLFETAFNKITIENRNYLKLACTPNLNVMPIGTGVEISTGEDNNGEQQSKPVAKSKNGARIKYTCSCGVNVWGKPELNIICGECENKFEISAEY